MADLKFKFNVETEEVELWVNDKVATKVESNIVESWIAAYNKKHGFVKPEPVVEESTTEEGKTDDNKDKPKEEQSNKED